VAGTAVLVAVDQEPWGIQRLHDLVPAYPHPKQLPQLSETQIHDAARAVAAAARGLGVNMFLAPVLDILICPSPWLDDRTLDLAPEEVGRIAAAVVSGMQDGGVIAVAKHFPGFPGLRRDPAIEATTLAAGDTSAGDLVPFQQAIRAGVRAVMTGPAAVEALDPEQPASTSARVIDMLRTKLGFGGLIVSDDLDAPSTTRGRSLIDTAIVSLEAGTELLLLPGGPDIIHVAAAIAERSTANADFADTVARAARRVRAAAAEVS
jgi:beta-N-acetylhexosaminidase